MTTKDATGVKDHHRCRRAVIYVRQSSHEQAKLNTGSTDYQRGQIRFAKDLGWPDDLIEVVEDDLGLSGSSAAHRHGYLRIKERIERREIGAVFISDFTRLGRDAEEWSAFLRICRIHDVLIVIDGKINDPTNNSELLVAKILATIGEYDNLLRRGHLERGRLTKAKQGHTVSQPPCGYVRLKDGSWIKHPSQDVQAAVLAVFRIFFETRSCPKTVQVLIARGIKFPRHNDRSGIIRWSRPQLARVYTMLRNPAYVGTYAFRRKISDPTRGRDRRGHLRQRPAQPHEQILHEDHHEPYVSREEWEEVQAILRLNAPSRARRNLGPGSALLQGIIRCAIHGNRAMTLVYHNERQSGGRHHTYLCIAWYHYGDTEYCGHRSGPPIDRAVLHVVLERLSPPRLQEIRTAFRKLREGFRSEEYRRDLELTRLRSQVNDVEFRYLNVDPTNVHVKATLESRLEQMKRDLLRAEQGAKAQRSPLDALPDDAFDELVALCGDLPALLQAETTTDQDRKQLLRILIDTVFVEKRTDSHLQIRVRWNDGTPETPIDVPRTTFATTLMVEWDAQGKSLDEIVAGLNERRLRTRRGNPWTRTAVRVRLKRLHQRRGSNHPVTSDA